MESQLLPVHYLREVVGLTGTHIGCETSYVLHVCLAELRGRLVVQGFQGDLGARPGSPARGGFFSTRRRGPLRLTHCEASLNEADPAEQDYAKDT